MTQRRWLIVAGSVVGAVIVIAIAFGLYFWFRGSTPSPQAATWADQVCPAVVTWENQLKSLASDIKSNPSKANIETKIDQADTATKTLVSELKAIGPPKTPNGQSAKEDIKALAESTRGHFENIKTAAGQLTGGGVTGFATQLATISTQVKDVVDNVKSTLKDLQGLSPDLRNAIIHNSTCRSIA